MPVSIRQVHPVFVGEVEGIDCRKPPTPQAVAAIEAGMDEYAVLIFRDQNITDEEQIAFTRHFGELESYRTLGHIRKRKDQRLHKAGRTSRCARVAPGFEVVRARNVPLGCRGRFVHHVAERDRSDRLDV